jgi:hypothetical protein
LRTSKRTREFIVPPLLALSQLVLELFSSAARWRFSKPNLGRFGVFGSRLAFFFFICFIPFFIPFLAFFLAFLCLVWLSFFICFGFFSRFFLHVSTEKRKKITVKFIFSQKKYYAN